MNKIKHWVKPNEVKQEGLYLMCRGDVVAEGTSRIVYISKNDCGELVDFCGDKVTRYHNNWKFALLDCN